jgi:hypothetical protein
MKDKPMKSVRLIILASMALLVACSGVKQKPTHYSAVYVPPSSLTVPQWYIDVQNTSTCASDQNNGTTSTCGGSDSTGTPNGPMLTAYGLVSGRWNCQSAVQGCPRLPQNTTVTFLSEYATAAAAAADLVYLSPSLEGGSYLSIVCNLPAPLATGALGTVTALNAAQGVLLQFSSVPGSPAVGQLVVNTTHPGYAWVQTASNPDGGSPTGTTLTQPMLAQAVPLTNGTPPAEVTGWTTSDAVSVYQPGYVAFASINPIAENIGSSSNAGRVYVTGCANAAEVGNAQTTLNGNVHFIQSSSARMLVMSAAGGGTATQYFINDYLSATVSLGSLQRSTQTVFAGGLATAINGGSVVLDGDLVVTSATIGNGSVLGRVYVGTAITAPDGFDKVAIANYGNPAVYGPGNVNTLAAHVSYSSDAAAPDPGLIFLNVDAGGALQINGQTKACICIPGYAAMGACNQVVSPGLLKSTLNADAGTPGTLCYPAGGAFGNL